ncbi:hypothetical protein [Xanthomonas phage JGB6]|nr:hypothetical protein [Xanthomonas phage JGB6]
MLSKDRNAHKELHTQARNEALQYSYEAYREVKIKRRKSFSASLTTCRKKC